MVMKIDQEMLAGKETKFEYNTDSDVQLLSHKGLYTYIQLELNMTVGSQMYNQPNHSCFQAASEVSYCICSTNVYSSANQGD